jgi:hypothetical protein
MYTDYEIVVRVNIPAPSWQGMYLANLVCVMSDIFDI